MVGAGTMDQLLSMSQVFSFYSRKSIGDGSRSLDLSSRPSSLFQLRVTKTFSSNLCFFFLLYFAAKSSSPVSAQGNFTLQSADFTSQSTPYNCSTNLICLGGAHVYEGNDINQIQTGRLSLTSENHSTDGATHGIAYYKEPIRFLDPFTNQSASFKASFVIDLLLGYFFYNTTSGWTYWSWGDGMAFVISADNSTLGGGGGSLGFFGSDGTTSFQSIVVEFDSYQNPGPPVDDISGNHVSFDFSNITWSAAANSSVGFNWNQTIYAWVDYDSSTQQLEVRVSNGHTKTISPLLSQQVNLSGRVQEYMWVGFSSGNKAGFSSFYIGNWTFETYGLPVPGGKSGGISMALVAGITAGIGAPAILLVCILLVFVLGRGDARGNYCQLRWGPLKEEDSMVQLEEFPKRFSYKELSVATGDFSEESQLGEGGFGSVYRGVLPSSGTPVAVKKIKGDSKQGEREFMAEATIISRLRHRNLIQLLGWCQHVSNEKYLLVYELMPNGSLDKVLFNPDGKAGLSWSQRFDVVTGTASALDYLHQGWKQQVIHRDVKSSNIMLDEDWNPMLGDFGLARLVDHQRAGATTLVAGTYGYIAPEAAYTGRFTDKTDVFAFGAVVLEVACGRKAFIEYATPGEMILVDWVWEKLSKNELLSTVDKRLEIYDVFWMEVMLLVGLQCSHPDPLARPSMRQVIQVLAGDAAVPSIPTSKPAFAFDSKDQRVGIDYLQPRDPFSSDSSRGSASKTSAHGISSSSNSVISMT